MTNATSPPSARPAHAPLRRAGRSNPTRDRSNNEPPRVESRTRNLVAVALTMAGYGSGALTGPILARSLGGTDRGHLAAVAAVLSLTLYGVPFGIDSASGYLAKRMPVHIVKQHAWLWTVAIATPLCILLALALPSFLNDRPPQIVRLAQLFVLFAPLNVPARVGTEMWLVRRGLTNRYLAMVNMALLSNAIGVIGLFVLGRLTLTTAVVCFVTTNVVAMAALIIGFDTLASPRRHPEARRVMEFASRDFLAGSSVMVVSRLDQLVLTNAVSSAKLGAYAVAANCPIVSAAASLAISQLLFGKLAGSPTNARHLARRGIALMLLVSVGLNITLGLSAHWLIPFVFGKEFSVSVPPLLVLLPGQVFADLFNVRAAILRADGRPGTASLSRFVGAMVTVLGIFPAVWIGGIMGAAALTSASNIASFLALRHFGPAHGTHRFTGRFATRIREP